ncbi:unnamed protein product, partial [Gulo gulo]
MKTARTPDGLHCLKAEKQIHTGVVWPYCVGLGVSDLRILWQTCHHTEGWCHHPGFLL